MTSTHIKAAAVILMLIFAAGCSQTTHALLHNIAKEDCHKIINPEERRNCENAHNHADFETTRKAYERE